MPKRQVAATIVSSHGRWRWPRHSDCSQKEPLSTCCASYSSKETNWRG
jgi:hypothetical protein